MSKSLKDSWRCITIDSKWIVIQILISVILPLLPNTEEGDRWLISIGELLNDAVRRRND